MPRQERAVLTLQCVLTDEELREKTIEHTHLLDEIDQLNDDLKSLKKRMMATIAEKEAEEASLRIVVNTGREHRKVECTINYDWEKKKKFFIRSDTGNTANVEPISDFELQEEMKLREEENEQVIEAEEPGFFGNSESDEEQESETTTYPIDEQGNDADVQEDEELPAD